MKRCNYYLYRILISLVVVILITLLHKQVAALTSVDVSDPVNDAAMKLVQFCNDPKTGFDEQSVAVLVDYVLSPKQSKEYALPKSMDSTGVYYEFDTKISFSRFIEYSYNPLIPPVITRPSSLRYSIWNANKDEARKLPSNWKLISPGGAPVIIHGIQHESDTPDLNTGIYHEYDLKRTFILLNYKGRQVMVSISKQISRSNVGKKGIILGNDNGWSYYYSGEPGSATTGLGWVKTYIYDLFSVGIYVEPGNAPVMVRSGVFQWLRAGWSGINFVKPKHILEGLKRFSRDCRMNLESPRMPAPDRIISVYEWLSNMPADDLNRKYAALQQGQLSSAIQTGKISKSDADNKTSFAGMQKEQMLQELMLEYIKMIFGKQTLLGKRFGEAGT
jgi:hypothetical protein